jgi:hypothetical protein
VVHFALGSSASSSWRCHGVLCPEHAQLPARRAARGSPGPVGCRLARVAHCGIQVGIMPPLSRAHSRWRRLPLQTPRCCTGPRSLCAFKFEYNDTATGSTLAPAGPAACCAPLAWCPCTCAPKFQAPTHPPEGTRPLDSDSHTSTARVRLWHQSSDGAHL